MTQRLDEISAAVRALQNEKRRLEIEADAWVEGQLEERKNNLERLIVAALDTGETVMAVAEAYTISGKTPNRNAIHKIKRKYQGRAEIVVSAFPFKWEDRRVKTVNGSRTVWDVTAVLDEFGPEDVSGSFRWTYDIPTGILEDVITSRDPYPSSKYYQSMLNAWLESNPYPGGEE